MRLNKSTRIDAPRGNVYAVGKYFVRAQSAIAAAIAIRNIFELPRLLPASVVGPFAGDIGNRGYDAAVNSDNDTASFEKTAIKAQSQPELSDTDKEAIMRKAMALMAQVA